MSLKNWLSFDIFRRRATGAGGGGGGGGAPACPKDDGEAEEAEGPPMERDPSAPIFYVIPPSVFEAIKPAKGPWMTARAERAIATTTDPSVPVFYVLPKPVVASMFPPRAKDQALAPTSDNKVGPWSFVMCVLGACGAFTSLS